MAELIRNDKDIQGIRMSDVVKETKLVLFADDATFTLKDEKSLERCLDILKRFGNFSSLQLNLNKSEIGWIGRNRDLDILPSSIKKKIDLNKDGIRILGMFFSHNQNYVTTNNIDRVVEKFRSVLNIWRQRNLTLYGKATIVNVLALSQLRYVFSNINFPSSYVKKIQDEIVNFIWNGKKVKIK